MIDVKSQLDAIEQLMILVNKYAIDEISVDFICIKKSRFKPEELTDKQIIDKHTNPSVSDMKNAALNKVADVEKWLNGESS